MDLPRSLCKLVCIDHVHTYFLRNFKTRLDRLHSRSVCRAPSNVQGIKIVARFLTLSYVPRFLGFLDRPIALRRYEERRKEMRRWVWLGIPGKGSNNERR